MPSNRRDAVRARLLEWARADDRVVGAAITGSAAVGREDEWSDVDLFFGVTDVAEVLTDVSGFLYQELGAVHHFDLAAGPAAYRGSSWTTCSKWTSAWRRPASSGPTAPRPSG